MNNNHLAAETTDVFIKEAYEAYVIKLVGGSSFTLLIYAAILKFPEEMKHIWLRRFSLPTWLYIFTRYGPLTQQGLVVGYNTVPAISKKLCKVLNDVQLLILVLSYIGIQGLLIARAYSLSRRNKTLAAVLVIGFVAGLGLSAISITPFSPCAMDSTLLVEQPIVSFLQNLSVIFTDLVVFGVCVWQIRGIWKLRVGVGIQSRSSLVSILLKQSMLRFCFVISTSVSVGVFVLIDRNSTLVVTDVLNIFQNCLSAILVADFTLELRQRNSPVIETANVTMSVLQFQTTFRNIHQSLLVEMGTPEDSFMGEEDNGDENDDAEDVTSSRSEGETAAVSA